MVCLPTLQISDNKLTSLPSSQCGIDHAHRGSKARHIPRPFTKCLAHAEIVCTTTTRKILRVRGYFQHNSACKDAFFTHIPRVPVDPAVFRIALSQLNQGASLDDVYSHNRELIKTRAYPGMHEDPSQWKSRWLLRPSDTRSLYRQYSRLQGIKVTEKPHLNIDDWLNPSSPDYKPALEEAIFHYSPRAAKGERFEACVATEEMKEAAWRYGDKGQLLLDGTFGVCDSKMLLFIVMAVDERNHGIPLAFLFFSAPNENKFTAAGYDTGILTKLLQRWKESVEEYRHGKEYRPAVGITDTDLKERAALLRVFPDMVLLICRVHLLRSWKNHRNRVLSGKSPVLTLLRGRLVLLEKELAETVKFEGAHQLLDEEKQAILSLLDEGDPARAGVLEHLKYLAGYWCTQSLWQSWSKFGREAAAKIMGCAIDNVIPTTNHLEAFNRVLKHNKIAGRQRHGRRLRIDVLIHFISLVMLPSIFEERRMMAEDDERRKAFVLGLPGGEALWKTHKGSAIPAPFIPICWLEADAARDEQAALIFENKQVGYPEHQVGGISLNCFSSQAIPHDKNPITYKISIIWAGTASCSCLDYQHRGGACKHIRAAILYLNSLRTKIPDLPLLSLPSSEASARQRLLTTAAFAQTSRESEALATHRPLSHASQQLEDLFAVEGNTREAEDTRENPSNGQCCTGSNYTSSEETDNDDNSDDDDDESSNRENGKELQEDNEFNLVCVSCPRSLARHSHLYDRLYYGHLPAVELRNSRSAAPCLSSIRQPHVSQSLRT